MLTDKPHSAEPNCLLPRIPSYFKPSFAPLAEKDAMVVAGNARFTILTDRLIRMEYDPSCRFEDRPSLVFWRRSQPVPEFSATRGGGTVEITTGSLRLTYRDTGNGFKQDNLQVELLEGGGIWRFGDVDEKNLGGTVRTLDAVNGAAPLPPGLMSRSGWAVIDDTASLVFDDCGWVEPRASSSAADLYFFGYGSDFAGCLRDFCAVSGAIPLPPRFVFGNWWSRYWEYSETELLGVVDGFKLHEIPLSVCVIDMDWHIVKNPHHWGWTGYSWNQELFPNPRRLLAALHERGLKVALNLHPHEGAHPHEEAYADFARFMGMDLSSKRPIKFDPADPRFMEGYFRFLHHPREEEGVDFWWMDWQQGAQSSMPGLDPLWWLNHLHALDRQRDGRSRPLILSRWAGWGNQRYPIGFTGDTFVTWESLAFQPYLTATAANAGCCFWSHDIGGHMFGTEDPELYIRWIQFGVFSPVLRIHSTKLRFQDRRPWMLGCEVLHISGDYLRLRHKLIPYIYSAAYLTHRQTLPMLRPLYWEWPDREEAYSFGGEYFFGPSLLAAPVTVPRDPETRCARKAIWLPPGGWYDFFTGEYFAGDRIIAMQCTLESMPVFVREGAIVPLDAQTSLGGAPNPTKLEVRVFAGANGEFDLFEDDGETQLAAQEDGCITRMRQEVRNEVLTFTIEVVCGSRTTLPPRRSWRIAFFGVSRDIKIDCRAGNHAMSASPQYDAERECLTIAVESVPVDKVITVRLAASESSLLCRRDRSNERLEAMIRAFRMESESKELAYDLARKAAADFSRLRELAAYASTSQMQALCEHLLEAGFDHSGGEFAEAQQLIFWNNRQDPGITRHLQKQGKPGTQEPVPRFDRLDLDELLFGFNAPAGRQWRLAVCYRDALILKVDSIVKCRI